jgi:hypothetical protein
LRGILTLVDQFEMAELVENVNRIWLQKVIAEVRTAVPFPESRAIIKCLAVVPAAGCGNPKRTVRLRRQQYTQSLCKNEHLQYRAAIGQQK